MFSGIIEKRGVVLSNTRNQISVEVVKLKAKPGDSIAVNGVCLTVTKKKSLGKKICFEFDVSQETRSKTTIAKWTPGFRVNVEPAMGLKGILGGHIVQGHVDGVGRLIKIQPRKDSQEFWFQMPREIEKFVVNKGSVAVDGVSLTAAHVKGKTFSVALIPLTLARTNLGSLKKGDSVNLEADIIGKYVANFLKK